MDAQDDSSEGDPNRGQAPFYDHNSGNRLEARTVLVDALNTTVYPGVPNTIPDLLYRIYNLAPDKDKPSVSDIIAYNYGPQNQAKVTIVPGQGGEGTCDYPYWVDFAGVGGDCGLWKQTGNQSVLVKKGLMNGTAIDNFGPDCVNVVWNFTCWGFGKPVSDTADLTNGGGLMSGPNVMLVIVSLLGVLVVLAS